MLWATAVSRIVSRGNVKVPSKMLDRSDAIASAVELSPPLMPPKPLALRGMGIRDRASMAVRSKFQELLRAVVIEDCGIIAERQRP